MKKIPIRDLHIPFRGQPKHHKLYRDFTAYCNETSRNYAATVRMLMQRLVDEEGKDEEEM
ncbi:hypothetical protein LCGC14_0351930 [marine sediment metagenome]|uniref:Uncharacterized protein n=1 Tax=marine sediment metagenome TaxID=412755 RepID=A0A0F9TGG3_9ZZZZ